MKLRLDRFITLFFFYPLSHLKKMNSNIKIPILMYHSISDDNLENTHPYFEINTSPNTFAEHMKFLYNNHYKVIDLIDVYNMIFNNSKYFSNTGRNKIDFNGITKEKFVSITFDDGYADFYSEALPILERYGFNATVFLPTAFIGNTNIRFNNKSFMSWGEIRECFRYGIHFGSHTVNHPILNESTYEDIIEELYESKKKLKMKFIVTYYLFHIHLLFLHTIKNTSPICKVFFKG